MAILKSMLTAIVWRIRLPRVILAALAGAALSLGGLVFQALLRNPLAEPYILGISGGSAVGAIIGILLGLAHFPGLVFFSFAGSMATLFLVLVIASGKHGDKKRLPHFGRGYGECSVRFDHHVSYLGDAGLPIAQRALLADGRSFHVRSESDFFTWRLPWLLCFALIFILARPMNLLLLGEELAANMGVNVRLVSLVLLGTSSLMVSATVCYTGLLGFVGLVMPHLLRLLLGPDHRVLVPACVLGGAAYLILCDLLARSLPAQGEMPVGVITAMIGVPLFIFLLKRTRQ